MDNIVANTETPRPHPHNKRIISEIFGSGRISIVYERLQTSSSVFKVVNDGTREYTLVRKYIQSGSGIRLFSLDLSINSSQ